MEKITVVLCGGGVKGAFQAGFLYALIEDEKYEIENIYATSIGSILAPLVINKRKDLLKEVIYSTETLKGLFVCWPFYYFIVFLNVMFKLAIYRSLKLSDKIWSLLSDNEKSIACAKCHISAHNYSKNKEVWFGASQKETSSEMFLKAMRASTALWLLVPPYEIEGDLYVDGGSVNLFPVEPLINNHINNRIFFIDNSTRLNKPGRTPPKNALELMFNLHDETLNKTGKLQLQLMQQKYKSNFVEIRPDEDIFSSSTDFDETKIEIFFQKGLEFYKKLENPFIVKE